MSIVENLPAVDQITAKRKIDITYRSTVLRDVEIDNLTQEVETRLHAWLKSVAVKKGKLISMNVEDLLGVHDSEVTPDYEVQEGVVRRAVKGRTYFFALIKTKKCAVHEDMKTLIRTSSPQLTLVDPQWRVERAVLSQLAGPAAEMRAKQKISEWFPTKEKAKVPSLVLALVSAELAKEGTKFAPRDVVEGFKEIVKWLTSISLGQPVAMSSSRMVPMVMEAAARLCCSCGTTSKTNTMQATMPWT